MTARHKISHNVIIFYSTNKIRRAIVITAEATKLNNSRKENMKFKLYKGYKVYENGYVFSDKIKPRLLKVDISKNKCVRVTLSYNGKIERWLVHRLVMFLFVGRSNLSVNHIDGNRLNNHLSNLEYCTLSENIKHAYRNGLASQKLFKNAAVVMTPEKYIEMLKYENLSSYKVSKIIKVYARTIRFWRT